MATPGWYPDPQDPSCYRWWDGNTWTADTIPAVAETQPRLNDANESDSRNVAKSNLGQQAAALARNVAELSEQKAQLEAEIVETREILLLQEVGIYRYRHPLDSSVEYKSRLDELEQAIKSHIKTGKAVVGTNKWAINGSEKDGAKMVTDFCKLMLRAYNNEADNAVRSLKPHLLDSSITRLQNARSSISKLGASMRIRITDEYHALRVKELELTADFLAKVVAEKEQEREERARLKEEEAARRDYEREQAKLEKERAQYELALNALRMRGDEAAVQEAEQKIAQIQEAIEGVISRAANVRAGYVYAISNIGSFGESVVKIGMTRRLDPMDRVRELGDASVPFRFDVHAIIFSEDAVGLETSLHQRFADRRVNCVNLQREFFYVTPQQVKEALLELRGNLLSFTDTPEAAEWRQSRAKNSPQYLV